MSYFINFAMYLFYHMFGLNIAENLIQQLNSMFTCSQTYGFSVIHTQNCHCIELLAIT